LQLADFAQYRRFKQSGLNTDMTRHDYLQAMIDASLSSDGYAEFRPFAGWWLVFPDGRYFGDDGEYLGRNWREAEATLKWMLTPAR
jgi:hypothetical protein